MTLSTRNDLSFHFIFFVASLAPCYFFLFVVGFLVSWLLRVTLREVPVACALQKIENTENTLLCTFAKIYRLFFHFKNRLGTNRTGSVSWVLKNSGSTTPIQYRHHTLHFIWWSIFFCCFLQDTLHHIYRFQPIIFHAFKDNDIDIVNQILFIRSVHG